MPRASLALVASLALATAAAGGCAARGGTPRPFPTPGGPPASAPEGTRAPGPVPAPVVRGGGLARLLDTALSVVGTPYRAGGDTPDAGFDCSGFVTWVFHEHGVALPRTVDALFDAGDAVEHDDGPAPGDLVFFDTEGRGATHVGIALGDGRFVHAPSSRGVVRVESLGASYWVRRYLGARRVLATNVLTRAEPAMPPRQ